MRAPPTGEAPAVADSPRVEPAPAVAPPEVGQWRHYLLPLVLGFVVAQLWFDGDKLLAGGDIGPFIFSGNIPEFLSSWNHSITGAGSASFRISVAPAIVLDLLVTSLGGSHAMAQRLWYGSLMAGVGFGGSYFAAAFTRTRAAVVCAGVICLFNPFILTEASNPMALISLGLMGVLGGMVLRGASGSGPHPVWFALVSVGSCYLINNPPSFAVAALWVASIAALSPVLRREASIANAARYLARAAPWCLGLNLWWIAPFLLTLTSSGEDLAVAAERRVRAWAWTHRRSSVRNVLSLNTKWAWPLARYYPWAPHLEKGIWPSLPMLLPATVVATPFLVTKAHRRPTRALVLVLAPLVLLSKGVHPPLASVNLWLYDHVPGFWLLRSPGNKLAPALVLIYGAVLAMLLSSAIERNGSMGPGADQRRFSWSPSPVLVGAVVMASVLYPYPLWNGGLFDVPSDTVSTRQVDVPRNWFTLADHLNSSEFRGKVLQLPLLDYYQIRTTWNYYGVDSLAAATVSRPIIQRLPGAYFAAGTCTDELLTRVEAAVRDQDVEVLPSLLQALGVSHVLVRHDFATVELAKRKVTPPDRVTAGLSRTVDLRSVLRNDVGEIFEFAAARGLVQAYDGESSPTVGAEPLAGTAPTEGGCASTSELAAAGSEGTVRLRWDRAAPWRFVAEVPDPPEEFHLVLAESYSPHWKLSGAGFRGATHVRASGYANGWIITGAEGPLRLSIEYGPARVARVGLFVSMAVLAVAMVLLAPRALRRRLTPKWLSARQRVR